MGSDFNYLCCFKGYPPGFKVLLDQFNKKTLMDQRPLLAQRDIFLPLLFLFGFQIFLKEEFY